VCPRKVEDAQISIQIRELHEESRQTYGSPRIQEALLVKGRRVSRKRIARLMNEEGIYGRKKRKFKHTTDSNHSYPIAQLPVHMISSHAPSASLGLPPPGRPRLRRDLPTSSNAMFTAPYGRSSLARGPSTSVESSTSWKIPLRFGRLRRPAWREGGGFGEIGPTWCDFARVQLRLSRMPSLVLPQVLDTHRVSIAWTY
jgi:hypothetical protein